MAKKTRKNLEITRHEIPIQGVYSNELTLGASSDVVVINFGLTVPKHFEIKVESFPVARIVLNWDTAEGLLELLQRAVLYRKKAKKPERKVKGKVVEGEFR
jgi:hypothetical protein